MAGSTPPGRPILSFNSLSLMLTLTPSQFRNTVLRYHPRQSLIDVQTGQNVRGRREASAVSPKERVDSVHPSSMDRLLWYSTRSLRSCCSIRIDILRNWEISPSVSEYDHSYLDGSKILFWPSQASVTCFLEYEEAKETYNKCLRGLLSRALARLKQEFHTKVLVGFEIEFILLGQNY